MKRIHKLSYTYEDIRMVAKSAHCGERFGKVSIDTLEDVHDSACLAGSRNIGIGAETVEDAATSTVQF
ncbi:MAG TPA: hypothetical protein VFM10_11850 [Terriglobales bacterium]|nr:hypothetical protein [Terriglobales bacterium]